MKKQNLLFISFLLSIGISFYSCNIGEGKNITRFPPTPAVVDKIETGITILGTPFGYIAAPSLSNYSSGDCLYLYSFTIDYDNQPSTQYLTATEIEKENVKSSNLVLNTSDELESDTLDTHPLSTLDFQTNPFYRGKFFILISSKYENPSFRLVYNKEETNTDEVKNLYLLSKSSSQTAGSDIKMSLNAFDVYSLFQNSRDTTFVNDSNEYKYIRVNLNYLPTPKEGDDKAPIYKPINDKPIEIFIFK